MFTSNQKPENHALNIHFNGLCHLYAFVKSEEAKMIAKYPGFGFSDFGSSDRDDIIFNHFIWYSNSFVPFIDLFKHAYSPREDLRNEFRFVKKWRNKVSAHFSLIRPIQDSAAVQGASVNQFLTWTSQRFSVGREVFFNVDTGDSTSEDWGWELTEVHERVLPILTRYA